MCCQPVSSLTSRLCKISLKVGYTGTHTVRYSWAKTSANLVITLNDHDIQHNAAAAAKKGKGTPLSIEDVKLHVLAKGNLYNMAEQKFYAGKSGVM